MRPFGSGSKRLISKASPNSTADRSSGMAGMSQAPILILTTPYALAPPIAMTVWTAVA